MSDLLTTKQLQDLLKIDRVTVYRMLNDGRLKGVKIGNQWRFPKAEIDRLLGSEEEMLEEPVEKEAIQDFPVDCAQRVQEIFAGIIGIGAITVNLRGDSLTEVNYSNPFCKMILASPEGHKACKSSWRKIALHSTGEPPFQVCHAGLCYQRSIIKMEEKPTAWLIAGQFYVNTPDSEKEQERLTQLSQKYNLPLAQLKEFVRKIPVLNQKQQAQVQEWTPKVASTIESFLCERADLMDRLEKISELSTVRTTLKPSQNP
jgi:excisionase family DNA binding protein